MVTRPRYLVRLSNDKGYRPQDWPALSASANDALRDLGANVGAIRIATNAIGLHLFVDSEDQLNLALERLTAAVGGVISHSRLDVPSEPKPKDVAVREAKDLFNEERYWECHDVLEKTRLEASGREPAGAEAKILQGFILVAAAFMHHQRAEDETALSVLRRALRKLEAWSESRYLSLDVESIRENVRRILEAGAMTPFSIA